MGTAGRGRKKTGYVYTARVVGSRRTISLETKSPLESGQVVKHDRVEYQVAYIYGTGAEARVILRVLKRGPGRPRKHS